MNKKNPYMHRTAIRDTNCFYGREQEVGWIYARIGAAPPQSVSIVGDRRIGKSSLLNFIHHEENRRKHLDNPESYVFVLMDLQEEPNDTIPDFIESLLGLICQASGRSLALSKEELNRPKAGYDALKYVAREFSRAKRKLAILFDEFELVTQNRAFDSSFYAFLRGLASNYDVSFVISSVRDLQELCNIKAIANSPFFNIFSKIYLGPFKKEDAIQLIEKPSVAAGCNLSEYTDAILSISGVLPIFIQIACSAFFEHLQSRGSANADDIKKIEEVFFMEAEQHFHYIWDGFSTDVKEVVCRHIMRREDIDEESESILMDLIRRGYVLQEAKGYRLFSKTFAERIVAPYTRKMKPKSIKDTGRIDTASIVTDEHIQELAEELEKKKPGLGELIGECREMAEIYKQMKLVASLDRPVLVQGETGTGKELVAKAIHVLSGRKRFEVVNCAAIPKDLVENELFGHEKGAFTGADIRQEGKFLAANGGTIFLDEIGELDIQVQPKLLRVLEKKTFERLGGQEQIQVEARFIFATNRNLEEAVDKKQFRKDLYYRISAFVISLPPLRKRGEDILLLALHFLRSFAHENPDIDAETISPQVAEALLEYTWPGNVRELKSSIERAAIASRGNRLMPEDFKNIRGFDPWPGAAYNNLQIRSLEEMKGEIARIRHEQEKGDCKRAAQGLGIDERTLQNWLRKPEKPYRSEKRDLKVSITQYSSWEDIELETIRETLKYTGNSNPNAAGILGIALSTFLEKRKKYRL